MNSGTAATHRSNLGADTGNYVGRSYRGHWLRPTGRRINQTAGGEMRGGANSHGGAILRGAGGGRITVFKGGLGLGGQIAHPLLHKGGPAPHVGLVARSPQAARWNKFFFWLVSTPGE